MNLKFYVIILAIFIFLFPTLSYALPSDMDHPRDKWAHGVVGTVCSSSLMILTKNKKLKNNFHPIVRDNPKTFSFLFCVGVGVLKELYDDKFDEEDLAAQTVGTVLGITVISW